MRLCDFVIIGAMKCGTSTLHEQLALRSGLHLSTPKEPNFFSDDGEYAKGLAHYAALFETARDDQLCGESSTHYTKLPTHPHTLARMRRHVPGAKLIYVMRDPVQRLASQYVHEWSQREVRLPFEEAVRRLERYVAYGSYARQLEPYLRSYGPARVLPVFFERLLAAPDEEFSRVCAFLGDRSPEPARWRADLPPQNVSSLRMRKSPFRSTALAVPGVRPLVDRLPGRLRERLKDAWRETSRPELSPALRAGVEARLDADLLRLGSWLGTALTCRGWQEAVRDRPLEWSAPPEAAA